jgi:copper transport protein
MLAAFALTAVMMAPSAAYAHPVTIDSSPRPFASVSSAPREVVVIFSEPIELSYSKISVLGPDGSRVDTNDPRHADGDTATIAVTLQPSLPEGVYTVTTKVLSAVDGHVVDGAITFGIGTAPAQGGGNQTGAPSEIISPAESASRFPGMVGQVMVVGAAFGTLWLWRPIDRVPWLSGAVATKRPSIDRAMLKIVIIGAALVLASNVAIITVQAIDIGASIADAIATRFGSVWMTRMIESSILMIIAFVVWRKAVKNDTVPSRAEMLAVLVMGLAVLVTSSLIAHAAATENVAAILIDFFHNAAASIWIGGLILMGFVAVPRLMSLEDERARSAAVSILIPRFSTVVVTILGLVLITGPLLLFFIESDLSLTLASTYGKILAAKLGLAGVMVAMGAYSQFAVQKKAVTAMAGGGSSVSVGRFGRMLKAEAGVGIALLLLVSLMANGALPAGEFPQHQRQSGQAAFADEPAASKHYVQTIYTSAGRVDLSIDPFVVGQNKFTLSFFAAGGSVAQDVEEATIKLTQVEKDIGPIEVGTKKGSPGVFTADAAFSLPGTWMMEIEGIRPESENIVASLDVEVRPAISSLSFDLKEYKIPPPSLPLYPVVDEQRQSVWTGDSLPRSGRIWQLDMETGNYTAHPIGNVTLVTQVTVDPSGKLWYIDPTESKLGLYDPDEKTNVQYILPSRGIISGLAQDGEGNLWMPVVQANKVVKFSPADRSFAQFDIPTPDSRPVGIAVDSSGSNIWLAESTGRIARIDVSTGEIEEFEPAGANKLIVPTAVFPDPDGHDIYISEHDGHTVTAFNPLFHTFREYPQLNEGGLPFGMAQDAFGNLWYAQHEIDRIAVIDPRTGEGTEVKIPTSGSFVQWLASDEKGRIWFAEQRGAALGVVTVTARPQIPQQPGGGEEPEQPGAGVPDLGFSLADAAGPAIVAGIVLSALFYAKSATDLKRNMRAAEKMMGQ